ncbi:hypothetical protein C8R44DRAFT_846596 [Mycena epipterygia]|nr:hypothetical protein C8R44DRAFT_846596 [Mycena epipterygia]
MDRNVSKSIRPDVRDQNLHMGAKGCLDSDAVASFLSLWKVVHGTHTRRLLVCSVYLPRPPLLHLFGTPHALLAPLRTVLSPTVCRGSIANAESSTWWSLTESTPTIKRMRIDNDRRSSWRACQRQICEDLQWDYAQLYRKVSQLWVAVAAARVRPTITLISIHYVFVLNTTLNTTLPGVLYACVIEILRKISGGGFPDESVGGWRSMAGIIPAGGGGGAGWERLVSSGTVRCLEHASGVVLKWFWSSSQAAQATWGFAKHPKSKWNKHENTS